MKRDNSAREEMPKLVKVIAISCRHRGAYLFQIINVGHSSGVGCSPQLSDSSSICAESVKSQQCFHLTQRGEVLKRVGSRLSRLPIVAPSKMWYWAKLLNVLGNTSVSVQEPSS